MVSIMFKDAQVNDLLIDSKAGAVRSNQILSEESMK